MQSAFCFGLLIYLFLAQLDSAHMRAQMQTSAQFKFAFYVAKISFKTAHFFILKIRTPPLVALGIYIYIQEYYILDIYYQRISGMVSELRTKSLNRKYDEEVATSEFKLRKLIFIPGDSQISL